MAIIEVPIIIVTKCNPYYSQANYITTYRWVLNIEEDEESNNSIVGVWEWIEDENISDNGATVTFNYLDKLKLKKVNIIS